MCGLSVVCLFVVCCLLFVVTLTAIIAPHVHKHKLRRFASAFVRQRVFVLLRHPEHVRRAQPERVRVDPKPHFARFAPQHHHDQTVLPAVLSVLPTLRRNHELPRDEEVLRLQRSAASDGGRVGVERNQGQIGVVAPQLDFALVGRNESRVGERSFGDDLVVEKDLTVFGDSVLRVSEESGGYLRGWRGGGGRRGGEGRRGTVDGERNLAI